MSDADLAQWIMLFLIGIFGAIRAAWTDHRFKILFGKRSQITGATTPEGEPLTNPADTYALIEKHKIWLSYNDETGEWCGRPHYAKPPWIWDKSLSKAISLAVIAATTPEGEQMDEILFEEIGEPSTANLVSADKLNEIRPPPRTTPEGEAG